MCQPIEKKNKTKKYSNFISACLSPSRYLETSRNNKTKIAHIHAHIHTQFLEYTPNDEEKYGRINGDHYMVIHCVSYQ